MSKERNFGDLRVGDIVWRSDTKEWRLIPIEVVKIETTIHASYIRIYLSNRTNFVVFSGAFCYDPMWFWSDEEKAKEKLTEKSIEMESYYVQRIDELITQYDNLTRWRKNLKT
jgi:hypothetical protein